MVARVWPAATVQGTAVPSGVSAMPLTDEECIAGARQRARLALAAQDAELGVGLEGGVNPETVGLMLTGWVVVVDRAGREGVGSAGRLLLPAALALEVSNGAELGTLIDRLSGETDSKRGGGAVGALTGGLVLCTSAFATAVAYALAPFISASYYDPPHILP